MWMSILYATISSTSRPSGTGCPISRMLNLSSKTDSMSAVGRLKRCPNRSTMSRILMIWWRSTARTRCACTKCSSDRSKWLSLGIPTALRAFSVSSANSGSSISTRRATLLSPMRSRPRVSGSRCTRRSRRLRRTTNVSLSTLP